jgi:hypothetical protein
MGYRNGVGGGFPTWRSSTTKWWSEREFGYGREKLFFILYDLKTYPSFGVLGYLFNRDGGNTCSHMHTLQRLLHRALAALPKRPLEYPEELEERLDTKQEILIDASERECVRSPE